MQKTDKISICRNGGRLRFSGLVKQDDSDTSQRSYEECAFGKCFTNGIAHFYPCGCIYYLYISFI